MECQLCGNRFDVKAQTYHPTKIFTSDSIFWKKQVVRNIDVMDAHVCPGCYSIISDAIQDCRNSKVKAIKKKNEGAKLTGTMSGFAKDSKDEK